MLFIWFFSFLAIIMLSIFGMFFGFEEIQKILFILLLFLVFPVIFPIIDTIKIDQKKGEKILTRAGMFGIMTIFLWLCGIFWIFSPDIGTLIFLWILFTGIFFALESRIFFLFAVLFLLFTVVSLIFGEKMWAEQFAVFLYFSLIIGVIVEILWPIFSKIHKNSPKILFISEEFLWEYKRELVLQSQYVLFVMFFCILMLVFAEKNNFFENFSHIKFDTNFIVYMVLVWYFLLIFFRFLSENPKNNIEKYMKKFWISKIF